MDDKPSERALKELLPYLEDLETCTQAILQLLKDRDGITDQELAPYLEQAGRFSNVKWRAARVRMEHLFMAVVNEEKQSDKKSETTAGPTSEKQSDKRPEQKTELAQETDSGRKLERKTAQGQEAQPERQPHQETEQQTSNRSRDGAEDAGKNKAAEPSADSEPSPNACGGSWHRMSHEQFAREICRRLLPSL